MIRAQAAALIGAVALVLAPPARAESPEISAEQWKSLVKAVRIVKRDYVAPVDDARLARACAARVYAMPSLKAAAPPPVTALTDVPVMLRAAAEAVPGVLPAQLVADCLTGMLGSLDAYTRFVPPAEARELTITDGAAVGIEITVRDQAVLVVEAIEGGPAAAAGIKPGDRVVAVAGRSLDGLALHEVVSRLRGRVGSAVTVTIARGAEVLEFPMTRATVRMTSVKSRTVGPGYLHLRVRRFEERTLGDIDAAIAPLLEKADTTPRALLIDLRDNPGGLFRSAIELAAGLLPPGTVIGSTDGRHPNAKRRVTGERRSWARDAVAEWLRAVPAAVLVNGGTASGSEIVTAALQAHGRATVLGTPTFGMGSIQTLVPLDGGAQMRLTTEVWLTPKGESFEGRPLTPDVMLMTARGVSPGAEGATGDTEVEQAVDILKTRRPAPR